MLVTGTGSALRGRILRSDQTENSEPYSCDTPPLSGTIRKAHDSTRRAPCEDCLRYRQVLREKDKEVCIY